ncbi:cobalamin biosynthesis protein CobG [Novosphingobium fluoreni]|uniref:cobalamin biosynthesis protein CobG n=1 Tax=Novosphingobium fluoreni TaxID=1391222 RepID=UPI003D9FBCD1
MSGFTVKGWCPDAWQPMAAGDGLLVRVKPRFSRLSRKETLQVCALSRQFGNGLIDVTRRANLQIRGVAEAGWRPLIEALVNAGLVDPDHAIEARRKILLAPHWTVGDASHRLAVELQEKLPELPELPSKMGFVIDAGDVPVLLDEPGDFRIERGESGGLILRAAGREKGVAVSEAKAIDRLIALAHWFHDSSGAAAGRMVRHDAPLPPWAQGDARPAPPAARAQPGPVCAGFAYGVPFSQIEADRLADAVTSAGATSLRLTPWRLVILEGGSAGEHPGLIADPADPLLRAEACPGAPFCPQATVATRDLARQLAPLVRESLHISGCAKGCACSRKTALVLTGREGRFDLSRNTHAGDRVDIPGLHPDHIPALLETR